MAKRSAEHFSAEYWSALDLAWVTAKAQMETELGNVQRRDVQRQTPNTFLVEPQRQYLDRGGE